MMKKFKSLLIVAILIGIGYIGYRFWFSSSAAVQVHYITEDFK